MIRIEQFMEEWNNDSEYVMVHTSGSTGKPKPMWVEKSRMLASARITCDFLGLHEGDSALLCMPLDYIAGKMMVVRALERGLRLHVVEPTGYPMRALAETPPFSDNRSQWRIDLAAMVPMQVYNSLQVAEERRRLRQVRNLIIGGGAVDDELARELRDFPHAVWSTYGMTETLSHIALRRLSGPAASDYYTPFDSVRVGQDEDGCLVIDAPLVCGQPLTTHDIVTFAPDGRRFRIVGRKDNVICSGGIKIQIEEMERLLKPHIPVPFMVTKVSDEKYGEAVVLLVEHAHASFKAICQEVLPLFWCPRYFLSVDSLPMTETGKPARQQAEQLARDLVSRQDCSLHSVTPS